MKALTQRVSKCLIRAIPILAFIRLDLDSSSEIINF